MKDQETIVIGGLLKDVKSKGVIGIPFLSKIPILGNLFKRETIDTSKVDLLIFITAHILQDNEPLPEQIMQPESKLEANPAAASNNKKAN
jgi:type II secretory pathway component GspD/PulD (secretin)